MIRALIAGLAGLFLASAALAQPPVNLRKACGADAFRLCAATLAVRSATARCMEAHWADLSSVCKSAIQARDAALKEHADQVGPPPATPPSTRSGN